MEGGVVGRCSWARGEPLTGYHDREWGVPLRDERKLFELLILEGAQAGLSWETILKRREGYRDAFMDFDPQAVAGFGPEKIESLLQNPGIIRNRAKVNAAVGNARATLELYRAGRTLSELLWGYVDGVPLQPNLKAEDGWPAQTGLAVRISKDLKKLGFKFVGPVIVYALMQSAGLTNDHHVGCFRHRALSGL